MRVVRQTNTHGTDLFLVRVWRKRVFVVGWYAEVKIGSRAWRVFPSKKSEARQVAAARASRKED